MKIRTKINRLYFKYIKVSYIALVAYVSGFKQQLSRKNLEPAKSISWTFDVEDLVKKIELSDDFGLKMTTNPENQGLYHYLLSKLDSSLITIHLLNGTIRATKDFPKNLIGLNLTMLGTKDADLKDAYELLVIKRIKAFNAFDVSPENALHHLACLVLSANKTREPLATAQFEELLSLNYLLLTRYPKPEALPSLYVLASLAQDKSLWKNQMLWAWELGKNDNNAFNAGLLIDAYPELLEEDYYKEHLMKCLDCVREVNIEELNSEEALAYLAEVTMMMTTLKRIRGKNESIG